MSKQDRQKLSILIVLIGVLGLTLILGYRMNRPSVSSAVQIPEAKLSAVVPTPNDARIRLDRVENPDTGQEAGQNNVFQYRQPRAAAPGASSPGTSSAPTVAPAVPVPAPPVARRPVPPPPPPIPLRYAGFANVNSTLTAFLTDDTSRHYNVTAGEILMGRYRIVQITDTTVEVEDLQFNRRQTLPLQK